MEPNMNPQLTSRQNTWEKFSDEKTKEKIHKHLSDINDTISEEDIKNVITDVNVIQSAISSDAETIDRPAELEKSDESEEYMDDTDKKKTTPWDVLDA